jgi:hypothetical protein
MAWRQLIDALVIAEQRVLEGERVIPQQEESVIALGHDARELGVALDLLRQARETQQFFIAERDRLREKLETIDPRQGSTRPDLM